jgi:hypothetical protein
MHKEPGNFYLPSFFDVVIEYKLLNLIMLSKHTALEVYVLITICYKGYLSNIV